MTGQHPPNTHPPDRRTNRLGRADRLRPASSVASSTLALMLALLLGAGVFGGIQIGSVLLQLTLGMTWMSVAVGAIRLLSCTLSRPTEPRGAGIENEDLPRYTVILPLFDEAHMVPGLRTALSAMDYPTDRLDCVFVCETGDIATIAAARAASTEPFRTLIVPPCTPGGPPRTKPRALNHVLERSGGDLVTIFDAEDRPHPGQLRAAARAFADHPDWAALQAPLDYFNTGDSWLAAQFGLEYASLFHVQLPFYGRLDLPFPLGGTSNHMRRDALERVGGWDPFNVTEDADLAFRLACDGGRIGWIAPPTQEEAVSRLRPWMRQRSRWLKGFLQTWLVHMNAPLSGGWRRALMLQLTLGVSLLSVAFFAPVVVGLTLLLLAGALGVTDVRVPPVYLLTLGFSMVCGMSAGALGAVRAGQPRLLWHVPLMPLYWMLLFPPLVRAIAELRTRPFHWHKTEHGVTGAPPGLAGD
ncbi:MAG: glycosyltransferase family 2 protein [Litorimonas sp.]